MTPDKICVANLDNGQQNWDQYKLSTNFAFILEISVCNGDNGGGLVYENPRMSRFYIRGVVSWTPTTDENALKCDPNQFSISTSVSSHRNFIRNYIENNQTIM